MNKLALWRTLPASLLAVIAAGCAGSLHDSPKTPSMGTLSPRVGCESMTGVDIPMTAIGLPTRGAHVSSATAVEDMDSAGASRRYCKAVGVILSVDASAAPIRFQVNLPAAWNQRALQMGGGGTNGRVVTGLGAYASQPATAATALAQGFVTLGSDSGHNADADPPFDTHFALNREQLLNFGQQQIKKTLDTAKAIVEAYYGSKPRYTYFIGGSQGGHEAFDAAQRYPDDYDGVVALYPAYNVVNMHLGSQAMARALYGNASGVPSPSWINPAKVATLVKTVREACDKLDGIEDGIIGNVNACNREFGMDAVKATLRCPGGTDSGDTCLSDPQLEAVGRIASTVHFDFTFSGGTRDYPRWPILEGATFLSNHLGRSNVAENPPVLPFDPVKGSAFQLLPAAGTTKGVIVQDFSIDTLAFDPAAWVSRIQTVSGWLDANSTDLRRFAAKGGKLLFAHGTIDDSITPHNSIAYFNRLVNANGQAVVDRFVRFYLIPGFGHGDGIFKAQWDSLAALQAWVERGEAPGAQVVSDGNTGENAGRTRPLCVYPQYPRYKGSGDVNSAASFSCAN